MHALEKMQIKEKGLISKRKGASLEVHLFCPEGLYLSQTDQFDTPYNHGIPEQFHGSGGGSIQQKEPPNHWHVTAETKTRTTGTRIGAVMAVTGPGEKIELQIKHSGDLVRVTAAGDFGSLSGEIYLSKGRHVLKGTGHDGEALVI